MGSKVESRNSVVEITGIDGSGKSSVVAFLAEEFSCTGRKVRPFSERTLKAEEAIISSFGDDAADSYRGCLLATALLEESAQLGEPAVFDRYVESARMWWTVKGIHPLPPSALACLPEPDLVIFLDVPVEVGLERRLGTTERDEASERAFLTDCRSYLRNRATGRSNWRTLPATDPLPQVLEAAARLASAVLRGGV